ncbi:MAG: DUF4012 domain-containing protein [Acidimicrobiia bacterium]
MLAALARSSTNLWLITFIVSVALVLAGGWGIRRHARAREASRERSRADESGVRRQPGLRHHAGMLVLLGGVVGLALAKSHSTLTITAVVGAVVLAVIGLLAERSRATELITHLAAGIAAGAAAVAGARLGPTGVEPLDIALTVLFVFAVTETFNGFAGSEGLVAGLGAALAASVFALAAFGHQNGLATVALGFTSACLGFLAYNLPPASLFVGRGARLALGYALAVLTLALHSVPGALRGFVVPLILASVVLLDVVAVALHRLRRRQRLWDHRSDHLVDRLVARGWSFGGSLAFLILAQLAVGVVALFAGRGLLNVGAAVGLTIVVLLVVGIPTWRARLEPDPARGLSIWIKVAVALVVVGMAVAVVPVGLAARDAHDSMIDGRDAATRGVDAARDGDTVAARNAFQEAAAKFEQASTELDGPLVSGGEAVPFVASNVRAARTLAETGIELARAGETITTAVRPEALKVVDGRLPVEEVRALIPQLDESAAALTRALTRIDEIRRDPYLAGPVRDAIDGVYDQLAKTQRDATRAAAAARLAPAIFGADGPRRYLLVVQNNAEARATGGLMGSYGVITADDGKLQFDEILRTGAWKAAVQGQPDRSYDAPEDYRHRYGQFLPAVNPQNINMTPDFPTAAGVFMSLTERAGVGPVDGVLAVDPEGLAALLELTGPVTVPGWPEEITSENVVDVTLRDAYAAFADTPERADFLGDVADVAIDAATSGSLGKPADIARVLGKAATEGHLVFAFDRPEEQALVERLGIAGQLTPVRSDALAVTTSNITANKTDFYLQRDLDYQVELRPDDMLDSARARAELTVALDNGAPASGLPNYVIGPATDKFVAGEHKALLSIYSPLDLGETTLDDQHIATSPGTELGRNVITNVVDIPSETTKTIHTDLAGTVPLHDGWYSLQVRHQPTVNEDHLRVSIAVPAGWHIDKAPGMEQPDARRATAKMTLTRDTTFRVHLVADPSTWDLWQRLRAGR